MVIPAHKIEYFIIEKSNLQKKVNTAKKIAKKRFVEESTIRSQVNRILKKFNVSNIKDLINDLNNIKVFDIFDN